MQQRRGVDTPLPFHMLRVAKPSKIKLSPVSADAISLLLTCSHVHSHTCQSRASLHVPLADPQHPCVPPGLRAAASSLEEFLGEDAGLVDSLGSHIELAAQQEARAEGDGAGEQLGQELDGARSGSRGSSSPWAQYPTRRSSLHAGKGPPHGGLEQLDKCRTRKRFLSHCSSMIYSACSGHLAILAKMLRICRRESGKKRCQTKAWKLQTSQVSTTLRMRIF